MIYLPSLQYFGDDKSTRFSNLLTYCSVSNKEYTYNAIGKPMDYDLHRFLAKEDDFNIDAVYNFAIPKKTLTLIGIYLVFKNMIFEFPENINFVKCNIYLMSSFVINEEFNSYFSNCSIEYHDPDSIILDMNPILAKDIKNSMKLLKHKIDNNL